MDLLNILLLSLFLLWPVSELLIKFLLGVTAFFFMFLSKLELFFKLGNSLEGRFEDIHCSSELLCNEPFLLFVLHIVVQICKN